MFDRWSSLTRLQQHRTGLPDCQLCSQWIPAIFESSRTFLRSAIRKRNFLAAAVGEVRALVELLIARTLHRRAKVDESSSGHREGTLRIARVLDRRSGHAGKRSSEGLRVALADGKGVGERNSAEESESSGKLHVDRWKGYLASLSE
jgi:hypothetical protein